MRLAQSSRLALLGLLGCLLIAGAMGVNNYSNFNNAASTGNFSYSGGYNYTRYINIPLNAEVNSAVITLNGYAPRNSSTYEYNFEDLEGAPWSLDAGTGSIGYVAQSDLEGSDRMVRGGGNTGTYSRINLTTGFNVSENHVLNVTFWARKEIWLVNSQAYRLTATDGTAIMMIQWSNADNCWKIQPGLQCVLDDAIQAMFTIGLNMTNQTYSVYVNGVYNRTQDYLNPTYDLQAIDLFAEQGNVWIDDVFIYDTGLAGSEPTNVLFYANGALGANISLLDGENTINFTTNLSNINVYPTVFSFYSNHTGFLEYKDLSITDTSRLFTFNFYDEQNASTFSLNETNTTLHFACPSSYSQYDITSGTYGVNVSCAEYDDVRVTVEQDGEQYYRTLVVSPQSGESTNIDWYLVNLRERNVVQIILALDDLTGYAWSNSVISVTRNVPGVSSATIIEQTFDVENKVYLYLMQNELYEVSIENPAGETWTGSFIADSATEKTVTLPETPFYPDDQYFEDNIFYEWNTNFAQGWINFTYEDNAGLTSYVNFSIVNKSDSSVICSDSSTADFTTRRTFSCYDHNYIYENNTYVGTVWVSHDGVGWFKIQESFGDYTGGFSISGWSLDDTDRIWRWFTFIFLLTLLLSFGSRMQHIGMVVTLLVGVVFRFLGILDWISASILAVLLAISVINWWRKEEVSER